MSPTTPPNKPSLLNMIEMLTGCSTEEMIDAMDDEVKHQSVMAKIDETARRQMRGDENPQPFAQRCAGVVAKKCPAPFVRCHQGCRYANEDGGPTLVNVGRRRKPRTTSTATPAA